MIDGGHAWEESLNRAFAGGVLLDSPPAARILSYRHSFSISGWNQRVLNCANSQIRHWMECCVEQETDGSWVKGADAVAGLGKPIPGKRQPRYPSGCLAKAGAGIRSSARSIPGDNSFLGARLKAGMPVL